MGQHDPRIDAYIARSAGLAQPILTHLRAVVHAACSECEEALNGARPFHVPRQDPVRHGGVQAARDFRAVAWDSAKTTGLGHRMAGRGQVAALEIPELLSQAWVRPAQGSGNVYWKS